MQKFGNKIVFKNPTNIFQVWLSKLIYSLTFLHRQTTKKLQSGWPGEALLVRHSFLAIALGIFVLTSFREVHKYKNTKLEINLRIPSGVAILWTVDLHRLVDLMIDLKIESPPGFLENGLGPEKPIWRMIEKMTLENNLKTRDSFRVREPGYERGRVLMHPACPIKNRSLLNICGIFRKYFNAKLYPHKQLNHAKQVI